MKRLILMVSILASVPAFSGPYSNSCNAGGDHIHVRYNILNRSQHRIALKFDEPEHGENPESLYLDPGFAMTDAGCSHGYFTGYETRATLMAYDYNNESYFDVAYLYIDTPFLGAGMFSFAKYNLKTPECSCKVRAGSSLDLKLSSFNCLSYTGPMQKRTEIKITCK